MSTFDNLSSLHNSTSAPGAPEQPEQPTDQRADLVGTDYPTNSAGRWVTSRAINSDQRADHEQPTSAGAADQAVLGRFGKFTSPKKTRSQSITSRAGRKAGSSEGDDRLLRWYLNSLSGELLPDHRVNRCCRRIAPIQDDSGRWVGGYFAEIKFSPQAGRARYHGLERCKSVWVCPICAAAIAQERRADMTRALYLAKQKGGAVYMLTLTMRHTSADRFAALEMIGRKALARMWNGKAAESFRARFGVVGHIRNLEPTYGDHGWHVHYHILLFTSAPIPDELLTDRPEQPGAPEQPQTVESWLKARWLISLEKSGGSADWSHGAKLQTADSKIADYVAKFGRLPTSAAPEWGADHEMALSSVKIADNGGKTPFELLRAYGDDLLAEWGDLFVEYAQAVKGKKALYWSKGLADWLGMNEPIPDELIPQEQPRPDEFTFAYLTPGELRTLVNQPTDQRARLLMAAEQGIESFRAFAAALGIAPQVFEQPEQPEQLELTSAPEQPTDQRAGRGNVTTFPTSASEAAEQERRLIIEQERRLIIEQERRLIAEQEQPTSAPGAAAPELSRRFAIRPYQRAGAPEQPTSAAPLTALTQDDRLEEFPESLSISLSDEQPTSAPGSLVSLTSEQPTDRSSRSSRPARWFDQLMTDYDRARWSGKETPKRHKNGVLMRDTDNHKQPPKNAQNGAPERPEQPRPEQPTSAAPEQPDYKFDQGVLFELARPYH